MASQVKILAQTKDPESLKLNSQTRQFSTDCSSRARSQSCLQNMSRAGAELQD